uniref:Trafficking protein particle complex subunit 11 domain-containing protein n=1 Tax=Rhizophora mucronata TaxID=61149 RepID=A0A2P2KI15_RHIMU
MEEYPEELRTPPVSLIALAGCAELHLLISSHLLSEQPPINTLALPDFSKISLLFSTTTSPPAPADPSLASGILKRDWLLKHRTRIPAVVAALFSSHHVSGDPAQWLRVCTELENLKAVIRPKNIKLAIIIVHSSSYDDISEDRLLSLRKRAEIDSKFLLIFNPNDDLQLNQSLHKLGSIFAELANVYYRDEGRRIKTRVEKKNFNSNELNIRYCFKVAVYAEFHRDWAEALRFYEDAYHILREMIGTTNRLPAIQRLVEIKNVAEQLHFKISTLLLHGGKLTEAVTWFHKHSASYRRLVGAPEAVFLHWEWMSRQFLVFAELLETSSKTVFSSSSIVLGTADGPLTGWEFQPAYYYQVSGFLHFHGIKMPYYAWEGINLPL